MDELFGLVFFFFKCCKNSVRGKGSLQQTMDEALWVRDTFIQKLLFGTFSGLSAGFVSRDSEINKTSPSPQGSFWDCQEIKQQLYSGEESARKRDGLEASKEAGGLGGADLTQHAGPEGRLWSRLPWIQILALHPLVTCPWVVSASSLCPSFLFYIMGI